MASRLSEINNYNVLLLEAGGDATDIYDIPILAPRLQLTSIDWQYKTERNNSYCRGTQYQLTCRLPPKNMWTLILLQKLRKIMCAMIV